LKLREDTRHVRLYKENKTTDKPSYENAGPLYIGNQKR
jgi:hypothetical protein